MSTRLSIIVPILSEKDKDYLLKMIESYDLQDHGEFITVGKTELVKDLVQVKSIEIENRNRALQFNSGINIASGETILLHHPRTIIDPKGITHLLNSNLPWGGFTHSFDKKSYYYKFTSFYSNRIRADLRSIFYFDHCIFINKQLLQEVGAVPNIDIFEDTALSLKLRKYSKGKRLQYSIKTSSERFLKNGFLKQSALNQLLKLGYYLGASDKRMNAWYEGSFI